MIGFIYKITPYECDDYYIGSTDNMKRRKKVHIQHTETNNSLLYKTIREYGGVFDMVVLYEYECENETQLRQEEQRALDKYKPALNMNRAYNSEEDTKQTRINWRTENREKIRARDNQKYQNNKEEIQAKRRESYKENKERLNEQSRQNYIKHKEKILARQKQQRQENKEEIREKDKKRHEEKRKNNNPYVTCQCGKRIQTLSIYKHNRTNYHVNYINSCKEVITNKLIQINSLF